MSVTEAVFYLLGGLAIASSVLVVTGRNPVACLLFLVLSFFCLAGLFVTLEAHFLAAIQILVYAGAILVLFLFVIMLLNLGSREPGFGLPRPLALTLTGAAGAGFIVLLVLVFRQAETPAGGEPSVPAAPVTGSRSIEVAPGSEPAVADAAGSGPDGALDEVGADAAQGSDLEGAGAGARRVVGSTEEIGNAMFRDFLLPFEVTSLLLLVAMVGAVMLAKRER